MEQGSYIVFRPSIGENVVTNIIQDGDVLLSQQEINKWYEDGEKVQLRTRILAELEIIDSKSIRALRINDSTKLQELESQAVALRKTLAEL